MGDEGRQFKDKDDQQNREKMPIDEYIQRCTSSISNCDENRPVKTIWSHTSDNSNENKTPYGGYKSSSVSGEDSIVTASGGENLQGSVTVIQNFMLSMKIRNETHQREMERNQIREEKLHNDRMQLMASKHQTEIELLKTQLEKAEQLSRVREDDYLRRLEEAMQREEQHDQEHKEQLERERQLWEENLKQQEVLLRKVIDEREQSKKGMEEKAKETKKQAQKQLEESLSRQREREVEMKRQHREDLNRLEQTYQQLIKRQQHKREKKQKRERDEQLRKKQEYDEAWARREQEWERQCRRDMQKAQEEERERQREERMMEQDSFNQQIEYERQLRRSYEANTASRKHEAYIKRLETYIAKLQKELEYTKRN